MTQGERRTARWSMIALALAGLVLLGAVGWRALGPSAPDPAAVEVASTTADPIGALERLTRSNPDDGEVWTQLGVALFDAGRFADAIAAFDRAVEINPGSAVLWSSRGEARIMASERDPMPAAALADFEKAVALDAKDPRARYFLAVKRDLDGDHAGAVDAWLALLGDTPPGAVWEADLRRTIEQVGRINAIPVAERLAAVSQPQPAPALPGPSAQDLRNASSMTPEQQREMAEGMVARLEARLKGDPGNVEGWIMLMRSRKTLGQSDLAARALADAVKANPASAKRLRDAAAELGIR